MMKIRFNYEILKNINLPVYIGECCPLLVPEKNDSIHFPVFVVSMPKSGTYLMAEILKKLDIPFVKSHIATHSLVDMRFVDVDYARVNSYKLQVKVPLEISRHLICHGQFGIGHIPFSHKKLLEKYKIIFLYREELRNIVISCARFFDYINGDWTDKDINKVNAFKKMPMSVDKIKVWFNIWGNEIFSLIKNMNQWKNENLLSLSFEELTNDPTCVDKVAEYLGVPKKNILKECLQEKTVTSTGKVSDFREIWTDELEAIFSNYLNNFKIAF